MVEIKETLYNIELNKYQIEVLIEAVNYAIKNNKELSPKLKVLLLSVKGEISLKTENNELEF